MYIMKFKIFLLLLFSLNLSAQNYKLEAVSIAWKNKANNSKKYSPWEKLDSSYFINIKNEIVETYNKPEEINTVKILKRYATTTNKNGDKLLRFNCRENGGEFKMWFIKYLKPKNEIIGEIILNFEVGTELIIYSVKNSNSHNR